MRKQKIILLAGALCVFSAACAAIPQDSTFGMSHPDGRSLLGNITPRNIAPSLNNSVTNVVTIPAPTVTTAASCPAQAASWGSGCAGSLSQSASGGSSTANNTTPNYVGTYTANCNNGSWSVASQSCASPTDQFSWLFGNWSFSTTTVQGTITFNTNFTWNVQADEKWCLYHVGTSQSSSIASKTRSCSSLGTWYGQVGSVASLNSDTALIACRADGSTGGVNYTGFYYYDSSSNKCSVIASGSLYLLSPDPTGAAYGGVRLSAVLVEVGQAQHVYAASGNVAYSPYSPSSASYSGAWTGTTNAGSVSGTTSSSLSGTIGWTTGGVTQNPVSMTKN